VSPLVARGKGEAKGSEAKGSEAGRAAAATGSDVSEKWRECKKEKNTEKTKRC
jgi:hypothetical protein